MSLTRKNLYSLTKSIVIGSLFFNAFTSELHAQCGFSQGLGCSNTDYSNFGFNSSNNAATIEYDNFGSAFHSTIVRNPEGEFLIWGENSATSGSANLTSPTKINSTNFGNVSNPLTGKPLKAVLGSSVPSNVLSQYILLTTTGLFTWGSTNGVISSTIASGTTFRKITVNGKADGLPTGVSPVDVKMLFATSGTLALVTCAGDAWVLSLQSDNMRGDGGVTTSSTVWVRVKINATTNLNNVVAIRGNRDALIALTSTNEVYTWGNRTLLGNETAFPATMPSRNFATKMTLPETGTVKMIGATSHLASASAPITYYILFTNGKLYAMGNNQYKQLGDFTTTNSPSSATRQWVQPLYSQSPNVTMDNVVWISPNEHDPTYPAINILNSNRRVFNWGVNAGSVIGRSNTAQANNSLTAFDPGQPLDSGAFIGNTSNIIAVETGGHTTMIAQECQENFGYVGHATNGSAGNAVNTNYPKFVFSTAAVQICGANTVSEIKFVNSPMYGTTNKYCSNQTLEIEGVPAGGTFAIQSGPGVLTGGNMLSFSATSGIVKLRYTYQLSPCVTKFVDRDIELEGCIIFNVKGSIWNDANSNAVKNTNESPTNGATSTTDGLWVNLINATGEVVYSAPVSQDGTYSLPTTQNGTYSVVVSNAQVGIGATAIPTAAAQLPSGWAFTGNNVANTPCVVPSCTNPGRISNVVVNGADVNGNDFGIKGTYTITGTIYHDANGLNGNTPAVNGNPIYGGSSPYQTQNQPQLYIAALDDENRVIHYVPVSNNGSYTIDVPLKEGTTLQLTTTLPVYGQVAPTPTLPSNWHYVGESFGTGNGSGTGVNNGTGTGHNATATKYDGKIHVAVPGAATTVTNVNFGIEQGPLATPKSYLVGNLDFLNVPPSGFQTINNYKSIQMNSSALVEVNTSANGSLSGSDPEDCATGNCNGNSGGVVSTFTIGTINNNTLLYYNYGGGVGVQPVLNNQTITNFDASRLVIYGENGQGFNGNTFGFTYAITDQAGIRSPFVSYSIATNEPLPLVLVSFTGEAGASQNYLNWITSKEEHILQYDIARSQNGAQWDIIGSVPAKNQYEGQTEYKFIDANPLTGVNLYRLKVLEKDAKTTFSQIISLTQNSTSRIVTAYPNPTDNFVTLNISNIGTKDDITIELLNIEGESKHKEHHIGKSKIELSLKSLPAGVFILKVTVGNESYVQKIIKK